MKHVKRIVVHEQGLTLIEILASVVILSIALLGLAILMYQNFTAIDQNKVIERSIFVRDDIKEWLSYRAQSQDIANLNQFVLTTCKQNEDFFTEEQKMRRMHLIADESGIQRDGNTSKAKYGEIERDLSIDRGEVIPKIQYDLSGSFLPELLAKEPFNKYYMGKYIPDPFFLVKITVEKKKIDEEYRYDPRKDGVRLNIQIYSKETGKLLTETYMNWIAEY